MVAAVVEEGAGEVDGGESVRHGHASYPGAGGDVRPEAAMTLGARGPCDQLPYRVESGPSRTADGLELFALDEVDRQVSPAGRDSTRAGRPGREQQKGREKTESDDPERRRWGTHGATLRTRYR